MFPILEIPPIFDRVINVSSEIFVAVAGGFGCGSKKESPAMPRDSRLEAGSWVGLGNGLGADTGFDRSAEGWIC